MLRTVLGPLVQRSGLPGLSVDALVHVALGGLYGAALYMARSSDPKAAQAEADAVLDTIIRGLRSGHTETPGDTTTSPKGRRRATPTARA